MAGRLLLDENLSPRFARDLAASFPGSAHVRPPHRGFHLRSHDSPAHAAQIVMASALKPLLEGW